MSESSIDNMQNEVIKSLERKTIDQEKRLNKLELQFADVLARLDIIIKVGKYLGGAIALSLGIDVIPMMQPEV